MLTIEDAELSRTASLGLWAACSVCGGLVAWLWTRRFDNDGEGRKLGGRFRRDGVAKEDFPDVGVCAIREMMVLVQDVSDCQCHQRRLAGALISLTSSMSTTFIAGREVTIGEVSSRFLNRIYTG